MGRRLVKVPKGDTVRPTQDKVRQALFSSLAARFPGTRFLDLFAGSGAVGLEAWSRGAARVDWVEADARVATVLRENIVTLCGSEPGGTDGQEWRLTRNDVFRFLKGLPEGSVYDIVFADPPYDRAGVAGWAARLLDEPVTARILAEDGLFVMEQAVEEAEIRRPAWDIAASKVYGGTRLTVYRRKTT